MDSQREPWRDRWSASYSERELAEQRATTSAGHLVHCLVEKPVDWMAAVKAVSRAVLMVAPKAA
jgi:hypothetical protein